MPAVSAICPVCGSRFDASVSSAGGRPREVCSPSCRQRRYLARREERARREGGRTVLEDLEALVEDADEETRDAYTALVHGFPGFRSTMEGTLRRAVDAVETPEDDS